MAKGVRAKGDRLSPLVKAKGVSIKVPLYPKGVRGDLILICYANPMDCLWQKYPEGVRKESPSYPYIPYPFGVRTKGAKVHRGTG